AAPLLRPVRHRPALGVEGALPVDHLLLRQTAPFDHLLADRSRQRSLDEGAHVGAEGVLFRREAKVHDALLCVCPKSCVSSLMYLEQAGAPHAAADAHGDDGVFGAAAAAFDQYVAGHARTAHPVWVADRDRTAVDVQPLLRNAEAVAAIEHLARERFVE